MRPRAPLVAEKPPCKYVPKSLTCKKCHARLVCGYWQRRTCAPRRAHALILVPVNNHIGHFKLMQCGWKQSSGNREPGL